LLGFLLSGGAPVHSTATASDTYLTIESAAEQLSCSKDTVRRMISRGQIKAYRIGHLIRLHPGDLDKARKPVTTYRAGAA
jgi:excisionase family DNA binding protein